MDIWEKLYLKVKELYAPTGGFAVRLRPPCRVRVGERKRRNFHGFCIESCSGVMNLCAERVAALRMYADSGQTVVKRMIAFRDAPPSGGGSGMPCGACREFFMQLFS